MEIMSETEKVAVVIPYYHNDLSEVEKISYRQCINVLSNYSIILLVPDSMSENDYPHDECLRIQKVKSTWLNSVNSYNKMMMMKEFYELFIKYEYILIYQLDAIVFLDKLHYFCELNYDYIGAPWLQGCVDVRHLDYGVRYVGNGGLSLRKVASFLKTLAEKNVDIDTWTEDVFWSCCDSEKFKVAPTEVALGFAFETQVRKCYERNHFQLPFGCHAWTKYDLDFWKEHACENNDFFRTLVDNGEKKDEIINYIDKKFIEAPVEIVNEWKKQRNIKNVYVFGTGVLGKMYSLPLAKAQLSQFYYLDNNKERWGDTLYGIEIVNPQVLLDGQVEDRLIIVAIKMYEEIYKQLQKMGIDVDKEVITYEEFATEMNAVWDSLEEA